MALTDWVIQILKLNLTASQQHPQLAFPSNSSNKKVYELLVNEYKESPNSAINHT